MYEEMRVKYLFIDLKYPQYLKLQGLLIVLLTIFAAVFYFTTRNSSMWLLENAWWLCLVLAVLEVLETLVAVAKAKRNFNRRNDGES